MSRPYLNEDIVSKIHDDYYKVVNYGDPNIIAPPFSHYNDNFFTSTFVSNFPHPVKVCDSHNNCEKYNGEFANIDSTTYFTNVPEAGLYSYTFHDKKLKFDISKPKASKDFNFAIFGDNQAGTGKFLQLLSSLNEQKFLDTFDILIHTGDMTQNADRHEFFTQWLYPLKLKASPLLRIPHIYTVGNHDFSTYATRSRDKLEKLYPFLPNFSSPNKNNLDGRFQALNIGPSLSRARIVVLDSNIDSKAQRDFIRKEVKSSDFRDAVFRIVIVHINPFTLFWDPSWKDSCECGRWVRDFALPLFEANGVDLLISGHQHNYQRLKINRKPLKNLKSSNTNFNSNASYMSVITGGSGGDLDLERHNLPPHWGPSVSEERLLLGHHFSSMTLSATEPLLIFKAWSSEALQKAESDWNAAEDSKKSKLRLEVFDEFRIKGDCAGGLWNSPGDWIYQFVNCKSSCQWWKHLQERQFVSGEEKKKIMWLLEVEEHLGKKKAQQSWFQNQFAQMLTHSESNQIYSSNAKLDPVIIG